VRFRRGNRFADPSAGAVRSRLRGLVTAAASVTSVVLLASVVTVTSSRAAFTGSTGNATNSIAVQTLDYSFEVMRSSPARYWRLDEPSSATLLIDSTGYRSALTGPGTLTTTTGAIAGNAATNFTSDCAGETTQSRDLQQFSIEAWFKTANAYANGGTIVQFNGNTGTGTSTSTFHDREMYLDGSGRVVFGTWPVEMTSASHPNNGDKVVKSATGYNNGAWHQAVGTIGPGGAVLYVDGAQVAADATIDSNDAWTPDGDWGQWHVGCGVYAAATGYPGSANVPPTNNITAALDEVAVYDRILTATEVATHHTAAARTGTTSIYPTTVMDDAPWTYQRFSGTPGTQTVATGQYDLSGNDAPSGIRGGTFDLSGGGHVATLSPGVNSVGGAIAGDSSAGLKFNGGSSACQTVDQSLVNPTTFSLEMWFKTAAGYNTGGVLAQLNSNAPLAIGNNAADNSTPTSYDRALYLTNGGNLIFATKSTSATTATATAYNDGNWHHVVATLSGGTAAVLYVDGAQAASATLTAPNNYTGYWHVGCGRLTSYPSVPTTSYFPSLAVDELAIYTTALGASSVTGHRTAGVAARVPFTAHAPR
jgi:hypothetical protein